MPVEVKACRNIKSCLKCFGPCFCCKKGHEGGRECLIEGDPQCPDYRGGLAFNAEEVERLERHVIFN